MDKTKVGDQEKIVLEEVSPRVRYESRSGDDSFWDKNKKAIFGVGGVIVAIVASYFLYNVYQKSNNEEAEREMARAVRLFEADSFQKAISGTGQFKGLQQIVDDYGSTKAGNLAKIMLGSAYYQTGNIPKGLEVFESVDKGEDLVSAGVYASMAYGYEEQNDFEKAAELYTKAAKIKTNRLTSPEYLMQAARCYEEAGKKEEALTLYKQIKRQYPKQDNEQMQSWHSVDKHITRLTD